MPLSKKPYKGTRDLFPVEKRIQDYIFKVMAKTAEQFGYEPYDGPLLEELDLYKAKSGQELVTEQVYNFMDRGNREVAIRPEMTPTLARMVAQIHREYPKPIRLYSIPNLYRYEKPQKGRLREHWQFNCDVFGAPELLGELEIFQVAIQLLKNFGANSSQFQIYINNRKIVDHVFSKVLDLDSEKSLQLYKVVDKAKKVGRSDLEEMVDKIGLGPNQKEIFFKYLDLKSFSDLYNFLKELKGTEDFVQMAQGLSQKISSLGIDEYFSYDPTIVRGLDYYTGWVFEIFDLNPENPRAISGGGAYENLLDLFNEPKLPGVGLGLGDVTLTDFLKTHGLLPKCDRPDTDLFISFQEDESLDKILTLAQTLREKGFKVTTGLDKLKFKKVFPLAEKRGAKHAAFMGSQELERGTIQIKNLESKEQAEFDLSKIDDIINFIKS